MKKITFISVLLAIAVIGNITAQRRTSSQQEKSKSTNERSYSEKSQRGNQNRTSNNRSSSVSRNESHSAHRKEITAPSRKVETNSRGANERRTVSESNRNRSGEYTTRSRNVQSSRTSSNEARSVNRNNTRIIRNESPATTGSRNSNTSVHRSVTKENRNYSSSRNEVNATRTIKHYPTHRKYVRTSKNVHVHVHKPKPVEYRAKYYPYRRPVHVNIVWTPRVYRQYCVIYPEIRRWRYHREYVVHTISAYDAYYHMGEVRSVYGKVNDTFYAYETDEYFLYIGARYPYQDFTVVMPGYIARSFHRNPERYFYRNHVEVTGLITSFQGEPEMVIKKHKQIRTY